MSYIRIEYDVASKKAESIKEKAEKINTLLTTLSEDMERNINSSTWSGDAADSFRTAWNNSSDEFQYFVQYLKNTQDKINAAATAARNEDQTQN